MDDSILNLDDGNNETLPNELTPEELESFLFLTQGSLIRQLLKFRHMQINDKDDNLSNTKLKYLPLGIVLEFLLRSFNEKDIGSSKVKWIKAYQNKIHVVGNKY